jgi:hypothetical protein
VRSLTCIQMSLKPVQASLFVKFCDYFNDSKASKTQKITHEPKRPQLHWKQEACHHCLQKSTEGKRACMNRNGFGCIESMVMSMQ